MSDFHLFRNDPQLDARLDFSRSWHGDKDAPNPIYPSEPGDALIPPHRHDCEHYLRAVSSFARTPKSRPSGMPHKHGLRSAGWGQDDGEAA